MTNNDDDKYHDINENEYDNKYDYDDEYPNNKNE